MFWLLLQSEKAQTLQDSRDAQEHCFVLGVCSQFPGTYQTMLIASDGAADLPHDARTSRPQSLERDMIEKILDTLRRTSQPNAELLRLLLDGMANLSVKPRSPATYLESLQWLQPGVPNRLGRLSDLLRPQPNMLIPTSEFIDVGAYTSTAGNEIPIVPEVVKSQSNQPMPPPATRSQTKPRQTPPAKSREKGSRREEFCNPDPLRNF